MLVEFCLPIYNEEKILKSNVVELIRYLAAQNFSFSWQIRLGLNGCTDSSLAVAEEMASKNPGRVIVENIDGAGKGKALADCGKKSQADIFCYMDVDLAVALTDIPRLLAPLLNGEADLAMGSRLLPDSRTERSYLREMSSQFYNFLSKIILWHNYSDLQCGFKALNRKVLVTVLPLVKNQKWFFDTELITLTHAMGFKIAEIPVEWSENRYAKRKSKISLLKDSFKFLLNLLSLRIRTYSINKGK